MKNIFLLVFLLIPTVTWAESAITCHCFQDRTFNHQNTAAADPYFLATTQNSFLSLVYNVNKGTIVKAKMSGTDGAHLWILFDLAKRSGQDIGRVEQIYSQTKRWTDVFKQLNLTPQQLGETYWQRGRNPEKLADHIVDLQLKKYFSVNETELENWRKQGMGRKELILAIMLKGEPDKLYHQVTSGMQTWGGLLYEQGLLDGKAINQKLAAQMAQS
jgi:hypothetical protein